MALKLDYPKQVTYGTQENLPDLPPTLIQSHLLKDVYVNIASTNGDKNRKDFIVNIYKDETKQELICRDHKDEFTFVPDNSEEAPCEFKQIYNHLKSLPDFADAEDC